MSELVSNGVHIYQFPTDDETVADINSTMNVSGFYQICGNHFTFIPVSDTLTYNA